MKSLKVKCMLLEERKSAIFFKVTNVIAKFGGPPLIQNSTLILSNEMEIELSKLKDKQAREFDNLLYFFEENIQTWSKDYVNLNKNIYVIVSKAHDDLIYVEK